MSDAARRYRWLEWSLTVVLILCLPTSQLFALPIFVQYEDGLQEGFNDPELGAARRAALEHAVELWALGVGGTVPIVISVSMDPLGGTGASALLASTAATTLHRNFPESPHADVLYNAALANQIAGIDVNGAETEIEIAFNRDVDNPVSLGSVDWYYGTDGDAGTGIDLVTIALHEIGHGLGFSNQVNPNGGFTFGDPGIFDLQVVRPPVGSLTRQIEPERRVSFISNDLFWDGAHVRAAAGGIVALFAPDPFQTGSSIAHWDPSVTELMAPFYTGPNHDLGLLLPALVDMGWQLAEGTALPSVAHTPTPTITPTPSPTPTPRTDALEPEILAFVSNFDDDTVSVIDDSTREVVDTVAVGDGPLGIVADATGDLVYVANYRDGTVSVLSTAIRRIVTTFDTDGAPSGLALTADGRLYATDTGAGRVVVLDVRAGAPMGAIDVRAQPSGIAVSPDGDRIFVAQFADNTISVIDPSSNIWRASIVFGDVTRPGFRELAFAPGRREGYVTGFFSEFVLRFNPTSLSGATMRVPIQPTGIPGAIQVDREERYLYVAVHGAQSGSGRVVVHDLNDADNSPVSVRVGDAPEALALTPGGAALYVANAGSNDVSVVDTSRHNRVATIPVGTAPMGIALVAVPRTCAGDCNGDRSTTVDELLAGVGIALGQRLTDSCRQFDRDLSRHVTIDELIAAVEVSLRGCHAESK